MNPYRISEKGWFFFLSLVFFRLSLEIGYLWYVSPLYSYAGFTYDLSVLKYIESWFILIVSARFIPIRMGRVSDYLVVLGYTGLVVPLVSLYALANHDRWIVYAVLFQFALVLWFRKGLLFRPIAVEGASTLGIWISVTMVLGLSIWYIVSGGIARMNFDLSRVYEFREDAGEVYNSGILGYVNSWVWKIFGPLLLSVALWKRWWWIVLGVIVSHAFWFSISNHKSILFQPIIVLAIWFWFRKSNGLSILQVGYIVVIGATMSIFIFSGDGLPASMFVRRLFYVIANNTFDYFYFFSENAKVLWSSSSVSFGLVQQVYDLNPAEIIGEMRGTEAHVNNSFLATGYMHAGWWGVVLYGILGGFLFRLIDSISRGPMPLWLVLSVLVMSARSLVLSADMPTALLTHGVGLAMLMVWLLNGSGVLHRISLKKTKLNLRISKSKL